VRYLTSGAASTLDCSGGTITYSGNYTIHTFTSTGSTTFSCPTKRSVEYLVVAGGGGGGSGYGSAAGGGGGAGGFLTGTGYTVTTGASITVTVGGGGAGGASSLNTIGATGSNSVFGSITASGGGGGSFDSMTGAADTSWYGTGNPYFGWAFRRYPGVFDVVAYTGTGSNTTFAHNLGVTPELMIVKSRNNAVEWYVWSKDIAASSVLQLNTTIAASSAPTVFNSTAPTASAFSVGTGNGTNYNTYTYVAYLFASKPGISKVGSYTGNGSSQNINAAFTATARFVMIKRTDTLGDWFVWDSTRGIVAGNDPHLSLNTTAAEVTTDDSIDSYTNGRSSGFTVNQDAATNINVTNATYIYLAFQ
jgi:hypothetical protein